MTVLAGWIVASAAFALSAGLGAALLGCLALTARERAAAAREGVRSALAASALARGAEAAVRLLPDGRSLVVGEVADAVAQSLADPASPLAEDVARLTDRGAAFERPVPGEGEAVFLVSGALEGPHPVLFVRRLPPAVQGGDGGHLSQAMERLAHPVWATRDGALCFANAAYERAVGAKPGAPGGPLVDAMAMDELTREAGADGTARRTLQSFVTGTRRHYDVSLDRAGADALALAVDVSEAIDALASQRAALDSHAATLDRLATAIAIYGPDRRLVFHNSAFQAFWALPSAFLASRPTDEAVHEALRAAGRLPEEGDFRAWERETGKWRERREGGERLWHLPDGQTLRVIVNPGLDGGFTTIFENVTEQLALERRYVALSRLQSETIDHLGEGIANFGPDGLLRLANPAFWRLSEIAPRDDGAHVRTLAAEAGVHDRSFWDEVAGRVTGLDERRRLAEDRLARPNGHILDTAIVPLPDGSTLVALKDVTDTVNVATALRERNAALVAADTVKNAFIQHVSYELRSPLNTIIGFTQLLSRAETGTLSARQREYTDYITTSSEALMAIVDNILDLATIDAGIMELDIQSIALEAALETVIEGLRPRLSQGALAVDITVADDAQTFEGDPQRIRQVLFNLLSNAAAHSPQEGRITVAATRSGEEIAIAVSDEGPGVADGDAQRIFERFMTGPHDGRRGGAGLGLSLVQAFVGLHGGRVALAPSERGATFVVHLPLALPAGLQPPLATALAPEATGASSAQHAA